MNSMHRLQTGLTLAVALTAILPGVRSMAAPPAVWTQHYDNSRTGANLQETVLNTANVNVNTFGKLFTMAVDGSTYAQPLYMPGLTVNGAIHNVLYVATMENSLYAFDADNGATLWKKNYGTPIPPGDVQCCCQDISGNIGIVSTPVIDTATNTLYLLHRNKNSDGSYHQWLRALDVSTGADKLSSPHEITGTANGIAFDPRIQNQRSALTLANGNIYIAWASHNDCSDYHGWVMSFQASDISKQKSFYTTTTDVGTKGGIWMSGQGLTVDASGNLYVITGNGYFDGVSNFGDSILKLSKDLTLLDYFTPSNQDQLNAADDDLGSGGVLGLPGTNFVVGGGKDGRLYLLDAANMGHFNLIDRYVQKFQAVAQNGRSTHIHGSPIYWNSAANGQTVYVWGENDNARAYSFNGATFNSTARSLSTVTAPPGMPGGILSLSANGNTNGSGIVWANVPFDRDSNQQVVPGILRAFDANNLSKELWNSYQNKTRDDFGNFAKFCPTVVANGKVYRTTFSNKVVVYGLLVPPPSAATGLTATPTSGQVSLKWTAAANALNYAVKRATSLAGPYNVIARVSALRYIDGDVRNGTTYYYKISGVNAAGPGADTDAVAATPLASQAAPAIPAGLVASSGTGSVSLAWNAPLYATGYHIKRATTASGVYVTVGTTAVAKYADAGLLSGTVYYYRVSAFNTYGESQNSVAVGAVTK